MSDVCERWREREIERESESGECMCVRAYVCVRMRANASFTGTALEFVRNTEPQPAFLLSQKEHLRIPQVSPVLLKWEKPWLRSLMPVKFIDI